LDAGKKQQPVWQLNATHRRKKADMKAIVQHGYGGADVLHLEEVDTPLVADDAVLVRVHAAAANPYDWHFMRGVPYVARLEMGLRRPRNTIAGADMAGTVEAVGRKVTRFRPGDEVYGEIDGGAFAEYACVPEGVLGPKPANLTFEQAAAVPMGGLTALQGVRDIGRIQPGQKVLVTGASGGVGTFAVQIAKTFDTEVTGVCSTRNVDLVRSLGADHVIDYTKESFIRRSERYDLILDNAGDHSPLQARRALTRDGTFVANNGSFGGRWVGPLGAFLVMTVLSRLVPQRMILVRRKSNTADLGILKDLIEAGKVTPIIDRTYKLSEVPDAVLYVERGHTRGKVVISV
jgi:NADPH:quinone reductase-like Zn-dependent oxidoreductase